MVDLSLNVGGEVLRGGGKVGNVPNHRVIPCEDYDALCRAVGGRCAGKGQVLGLHGAVVRFLHRAGLGVALPGKGRVIYLEACTLDDADVSREGVALLHLDQVAHHNLGHGDLQRVSIPNHTRICRQKLGELLHDVCGVSVLHVGEHRGDNDHGGKNQPNVQIAWIRRIDGVAHQRGQRTNLQQNGKGT
eukprot:Lithocolla_globosa_v1_NODE_1120_length_2855_cov_77.670357.p2 type:complete len:189 gc:universal NODE_1120_length_2855_cov_77.670357:1932-2498(+)